MDDAIDVHAGLAEAGIAVRVFSKSSADESLASGLPRRGTMSSISWQRH
jgi:hypothetical protein